MKYRELLKACFIGLLPSACLPKRWQKEHKKKKLDELGRKRQISKVLPSPVLCSVTAPALSGCSGGFPVAPTLHEAHAKTHTSE